MCNRQNACSRGGLLEMGTISILLYFEEQRTDSSEIEYQPPPPHEAQWGGAGRPTTP